MAQVKFIQLGTTGNEIPWADYNGAVDNPKSLAKAKQDYPGAIIFATYFNESNEKTQSIYANGEEYSVGGGGGGTVYVGTIAVTNGTLDNTSGVYKDGFSGTEYKGSFKSGDIYIYKKSKEASSLESSGYVYVKKKDNTDVDHWEALAGAVGASNVFFDQDITLAGNYTQVGNFNKKTLAGTATVNAIGKSLKDILEQMLSEEAYPTTPTYQSGSLSVSVSAPTPTISKDETTYSDGSLIAVGTTGLTTNALTANANSTNGVAAKMSGFTYGYADDTKGTNYNSGSQITLDVKSITANSTAKYKLSRTITGFSNPSVVVSNATDSATASSVTLNSTSLGAISLGQNKVAVTETSLSYTGTVDAISAKYVRSNLGNYSDDHKTQAHTQVTLTAAAAFDTSSITLVGVYPIKTNGTVAKQADGGKTGQFSEQMIDIPLSTTYKVSNYYATNKEFYVGFGSPFVQSWVIEVPKGKTFTALGYDPTAKSFNNTTTFTKNVNLSNDQYDYYEMTNTTTGANIIQIKLNN